MEEAVLGLLFLWATLTLLGIVLAFAAVKRSGWLRRESDFHSEKLREISERLERLEAWIVDQEYAQLANDIDLPEGGGNDLSALVERDAEDERAAPETTPLADEATVRDLEPSAEETTSARGKISDESSGAAPSAPAVPSLPPKAWMVLGAIAISTAAALWVKLLVDRSVLGTTGGLSLGLIAGALSLAAAAWCKRRRRFGGHARGEAAIDLAAWLSAAGLAGIALFVVAASHSAILPASMAFLISILVGVVAIFLLPAHDPVPAVAAAMTGFLGPALLADVAAHDAFWPSYLALWLAGWFHRARQSRQLVLASFVLALATLATATSLRAAAHGLVEVTWIVLPPLVLLWRSAVLAADPGRIRRVGYAGIGSALLLLSGMAWMLPGEEMAWLGFAAASALLLAFTGRAYTFDLWPWVTAALGAWLLSAYGLDLMSTTGASEAAPRESAVRLGLTILSLAALSSIGAYLNIWRAYHPAGMAHLLVWLAGGYFAVALWSLPAFPGHLSEAAAAALIAAGLGVLSYPVARRLPRKSESRRCASILLSGTVLFAAWAAWLASDGAHLNALLVGILLSSAWLSGIYRIDGMRPILAALASLIFLRLIVGAGAILTHVEVPGAAFWRSLDFWVFPFAIAAVFAAAALLDRVRCRKLSRLFHCIVIGLVLVWTTLVAGSLLRGESTDMRSAALWGTIACLWFVSLGVAARATGASQTSSSRRQAFRTALPAFALFCALLSLAILGFVVNPLFFQQKLGDGVVFNALFQAFALPGMALILPTYAFSKWSARPWLAPLVVGPLSGASFLLIWAFGSLSVRRHFHGDALASGFATDKEWMAYTLVWTSLGVASVVIGSRWRASWWRQTGTALLVIVLLKLFLTDAVNLAGFARIVSLATAGLGLVLAGLIFHRAKTSRWG